MNKKFLLIALCLFQSVRTCDSNERTETRAPDAKEIWTFELWRHGVMSKFVLEKDKQDRPLGTFIKSISSLGSIKLGECELQEMRDFVRDVLGITDEDEVIFPLKHGFCGLYRPVMQFFIHSPQSGEVHFEVTSIAGDVLATYILPNIPQNNKAFAKFLHIQPTDKIIDESLLPEVFRKLKAGAKKDCKAKYKLFAGFTKGAYANQKQQINAVFVVPER